jgi:hypothetical protein
MRLTCNSIIAANGGVNLERNMYGIKHPKFITFLFGVQANEKKNTKTITTFMMPIMFRLFLLNRGETARQEVFSTFSLRP